MPVVGGDGMECLKPLWESMDGRNDDRSDVTLLFIPNERQASFGGRMQRDNVALL
jgi:hypothetical protein